MSTCTSPARSPNHALDPIHLPGQRVAIVVAARVTLRANQPSTTACNCHAHFVVLLILLARLAFGDALDLRLMHAVNPVLVVPLLSVNSCAVSNNLDNSSANAVT
jgi:hypothetical protein